MKPRTPTDKFVSDTQLEQRIENLELKIMDMENTMQELNEVILRQYRDIEHLQLQQKEIMSHSSGASPSGAAPQAIDELPPHY